MWYGMESGLTGTLESLHIETVGFFLEKQDHVDATFGFEGCALVLAGSGFFRADEARPERLVAPAAFFIQPGVRYRYGPDPGTTWKEHYACFSGLRAENWRRRGWLTHPDNPLPLTRPETLLRSHDKICRAFVPWRSIPIDEAKLELERFVWELHRESDATRVLDGPIESLIQAWTDEPPSDVDLPALARSIPMSYSAFRAAFEQRAGLAPYQFLLRARIDQSCRLLRETNLPIKAIAVEAGFRHAESFCRAFLRVKAMSPGEFRNRLLGFSRPSLSA